MSSMYNIKQKFTLSISLLPYLYLSLGVQAAATSAKKAQNKITEKRHLFCVRRDANGLVEVWHNVCYHIKSF